MRAAPAVDAALGSGRIERMLITALHAGAGAVVSVWAAAHAQASAGWLSANLPWIAALVGASLLGALGFWLARQALPAAPARLRWDGAAWQLGDARRSELCNNGLLPLQRVVVSLDLGAWMLLQLLPAGGAPLRWHLVTVRSAGAAWHGLRVALQAHAGDPTRADDDTADPAAGGPGRRP